MYATRKYQLPDKNDSRRSTALRLAQFSRLAYRAPAAHFDSVAHEDVAVARETIEYFQPIRGEQSEGLIVSDGETAVASFAGTSTVDDWINSFTFGLFSGYGGRVHKGFANSLDSIWDQFLAGIFDTNTGQQPIWFTGHSLGGALATLAAWRAHSEGFDVAGCMTFGAPPIFNDSAATQYQPSLTRFENEGDMVTGLRWPRFEETFVHAGERVHLLRSGAVAERIYSDHLASRIDRFSRFLDVENPQPMRYGGLHDDHRLDEYIHRLAATS